MAALIRIDSRIGYTQMQKAFWFTFAVSVEGDLRDALEWLMRAYESAI